MEKNLLWYNRFMGKNRRSREFKNNSQVIDMEEARKKRLEKRRAEREKEERKAQLAKKEKTRGKTAIRRRRNRRCLMVAVITLCIIAAIGFSVFNVISLKLEQRDVHKQHQELLNEKEQLKKELDNINAPENLEEQARNQLRLVKPGEFIYLFPDEMTEDNDDTGSGSDEN